MFFRLCWRAPRTLMLEIPMKRFGSMLLPAHPIPIFRRMVGCCPAPNFILNGSGKSGRGRTQFYSRILMVNTEWSQREVKWHHQSDSWSELRQQPSNMTTFLLSTMLLLTIVAAFAFGVAAGYWVICVFLNFFNPTRTRNKPTRAPALVPSSGD